MVSAGLHTAAAGVPGIPRPAGLGIFRPHLAVSSAVQALAWRVLEHLRLLHKEAVVRHLRKTSPGALLASCCLCQLCQPLQLSADQMCLPMLPSCFRHAF